MVGKDNRRPQAAELRRRAEEKARIDKDGTEEELSPEQARQTLHNLRVHQIELEMQNEELRLAQAELEVSLARYLDLYNQTPVSYCTISEKGLILEANLTAATLLVNARDALVKQPISRFILDEDQDIYYLHRKRLFETGEPQACELRMLKKDGTTFWAHLKATAEQDDDGAPVFRTVLSDITERKRAEEEKGKLEAQLRHAQKMESVGRLAGGVAHDFNNMLGIIIGNVEMAMLRVTPEEPLYQELDETLKAAYRSADIVRQLLTFARKQTVSPKVLDLNATVSGMLNMLRRLIGEDIDLAWMPRHDLWPVKVDPSQIDQMLANLAVNARDAIAGVGKMTIETANAIFDEAYCSDHPGFVPGQYVLLAVSDDGVGMNKDVLDHLFEPFFTTKEVGKGTGLGLASVYGAVKQNGGFINLYSEPGEGTTFKIYLPRVEAKSAEVKVEGEREILQRGTETVLMVEDEAAILMIGKAVLESLGYTVLTAGTPREAIRLVGEHPGAIDLLLTDVVMPEMNGRELAEQIKFIRPGMKFLYMSGYTASVIAHHGVLDEGVLFIQKPFAMKVLAVKVREALDKT